MSWSYDTSLATAKDKVRLLIGDTDTSDQQLSDEEVSAILTLNSSDIYSSAIFLAQNLAAKYSRLVDTSIDSFRVSYSQLATKYNDLAGVLQRTKDNSPGGLGVPIVGGVSISDMQTRDADSDRPPSRSRVGMDEAPGVTPPAANNSPASVFDE